MVGGKHFTIFASVVVIEFCLSLIEILTFRPLVNIQRGIIWDNCTWPTSIDCPNIYQMRTSVQNSDALPRAYLLRITCCASHHYSLYCGAADVLMHFM